MDFLNSNNQYHKGHLMNVFVHARVQVSSSDKDILDIATWVCRSLNVPTDRARTSTYLLALDDPIV